MIEVPGLTMLVQAPKGDDVTEIYSLGLLPFFRLDLEAPYGPCLTISSEAAKMLQTKLEKYLARAS